MFRRLPPASAGIFLLIALLTATRLLAGDCFDYGAFPYPVGREAAPGGPLDDLVLAGDVIYAIDGTRLIIFTLEDPLTPVRAAEIEFGATLRSPAVANGRLYLAVDDDGVNIYDLSAPTAPVFLNQIPRRGTASYMQVFGLAVAGDILVYTEYNLPVRIMDVADPAAPSELGTIDQAGLKHVALDGPLLAVTGATALLYDLADPAAPVLLAQNDDHCYDVWESRSFSRPALHNGTAYTQIKLACNWRDPYLYGDPIHPSYALVALAADKAGTVPEKILGGLAPVPPHVAGDQLFLAAGPGYHRVHDLAESGSPALGYFPLLAGLEGLVLNGGRLYAATGEGLVVMLPPTAGDQEAYFGQGTALDNHQHGLLVDGDLLLNAYTATTWIETMQNFFEPFYDHYVKVWDGETEVGRIVLADGQFYQVPQWLDQAVVGHHLYAACDLGLFVADLSGLSGEIVATVIPTADMAGMQAVGEALYLRDAAGGVRLFTLEDPLTPLDRGPVLTGQAYDDMALVGNALCLRAGTGLRVADVTDPLAPVLRPAAYAVAAGELDASGDHLFVRVEDPAAVSWYSVDPAGTVTPVGSATPDFPLRDVAASADRFYATDRHGVAQFDLATGDRVGRVLAREAEHLVLRGQVLGVTQATQPAPFAVPVDCADPVPVFLAASEAFRRDGVAVYEWSAPSAEAGDFAVEAVCRGEIRPLGVRTDAVGRFSAVAPSDFTAEVTFQLYLASPGGYVLLDRRTSSPVPAAAITALDSVHPNPFNPRTEITYRVSADETVEVAVYDLSGRRLAVLAAGRHAAGAYTVIWDGRDMNGRMQSSGSYLVRLDSPSRVDSRKLLLLR